MHILTPEFVGINPYYFTDIPEDVVARASAHDLKDSLFWPYVPKDKREVEQVSAQSFRTAREGVYSVALTPQEYKACSESVERLAKRCMIGVLASRDAELRQREGNENARAREEDDIRAAKRSGVRAVMERRQTMQTLLDETVIPKSELINRFIEMTEGKNPNLARGTRRTVGERFENLRKTVFDDMLDVVVLQRDWTVPQTERAKRVIQKKLYISGSSSERVANFREMLDLANKYYSIKIALLKTKILEANKYIAGHPEVVEDIIEVDIERQQLEKEAGQLKLDADV